MKRARLSRGLMFLAVGAAATAVHVISALAGQALAGLAPLMANLIAYTFAVALSYLGNAWLTFGETPWRWRQFSRFLAISLAGLGLNQLIVQVAANHLGLPFWVALMIVVTVVPAATFTLAKVWVFRSQGPA